MIGFNSPKYDLNSIKTCLQPVPVKERDIDPSVIKKLNQFVSFNFGENEPLDIMNFLGGARSLIHS